MLGSNVLPHFIMDAINGRYNNVIIVACYQSSSVTCMPHVQTLISFTSNVVSTFRSQVCGVWSVFPVKRSQWRRKTHRQESKSWRCDQKSYFCSLFGCFCKYSTEYFSDNPLLYFDKLSRHAAAGGGGSNQNANDHARRETKHFLLKARSPNARPCSHNNTTFLASLDCYVGLDECSEQERVSGTRLWPADLVSGNPKSCPVVQSVPDHATCHDAPVNALLCGT